MKETYTLDEIKEKLEHEKYLRKENQELYEELQVLRKCSKELEKLNNIIKEARELLNQEWYSVLRKETIRKVREILDKGE